MSNRETNVLVTGGAGFIGSHIVDELIANNYNLFIIDNLSTGKIVNLNPKATFYKQDIRSDLTEIFTENRIDYVIHQAAQVDIKEAKEKPILNSDININGSINLFQYCCDYNVKKIIYASSAAVYGSPKYLNIDEKHPINPISNYGISKHTPESYLKVFKHIYNLNYTILRYSNVYGSRQLSEGEAGVISIFINNFLENKKPKIYGDGEQTRDFIHVSDIAKANLFALTKGRGEIINLSSQTQTSINELVKKLNQISNKSLTPIYKQTRQGDIKHSCLKNNKAEQILNWKPKYSLMHGLENTINYYK